MGLPTQYNLLDTQFGDFVLNAAAIAAIMGESGGGLTTTTVSTVGNGVGSFVGLYEGLPWFMAGRRVGAPYRQSVGWCES